MKEQRFEKVVKGFSKMDLFMIIMGTIGFIIFSYFTHKDFIDGIFFTIILGLIIALWIVYFKGRKVYWRRIK